MAGAEYQTLRRILVARRLIDPVAQWYELGGGKTNTVWRIGTGRNSILCKLYSCSADSPLFPNEPETEHQILLALASSGLSPQPLAFVNTALGDCLLYKFVDGRLWDGSVEIVAQLLAHLHALPIPSIASARDDPDLIDSRMISGLRREDRAAFVDLKPSSPAKADHVALVHGDPVPANILLTDGAPVLIDWQCPYVGDPVDDIATFLSPAMQSVYGGRRLSATDVSRFLSAYGNENVAKRYLANRAYYHWRMALHCAWKTRKGADEYADAMVLELEALQHCAEPAAHQ